jgi:hypothetical protein
VWDITTIERVCGNPDIVNQVTERDTLCAGYPILDIEDGLPPGVVFECSGTVTDTEFDLTCTTSFSEGDCSVTVTFSGSATRTGETYQGVETITFDYSPECGLIPDSCKEYTTTGTRTGEDPDCTVPVERATWSSIKARFLAGRP